MDADLAVGPRLSWQPPPPPGFDPLAAGSAGRFGLPRPPEARRHPDLAACWKALLSNHPRIRHAVLEWPESPAARTLAPRSVPRFRACGLTRRLPRAARGAGHAAGWSENWSGAYITPRDGERFTQAWGRWTVPAELKPPAAGTAEPGGEPLPRCSVWVGLGGHRAHARSLPQLGTAHEVRMIDGKPAAACWAWVQWWVGHADPASDEAREAENPRNFGPLDLAAADFPVRPGQEIICCLTVAENGRVVFHLGNPEAKQVLNIEAGAPDGNLPADGGAAEWIVERPTKFPFRGRPGDAPLHPLPDYGEVVFRDCAAETRRHPGEAKGTPRDLTGARLIGMSDARMDPYRSALVSKPEKIDAATLRVAYQGAR